MSGLVASVNQPTVVVDTLGRPLASADVQAALARINPALSLRAFPFLTGVWRWAICEKWHANDPRRSFIQSGAQDPDTDFDVVGWPPDELSLTRTEDVVGYLVRQLKQRVSDVSSYAGYLTAIDAHNAAQTVKNQQPVVDYANELIESNASTLFRDQGKTTSKVFQSTPKETGKKRSNGRDAVIPKPS